MLELYRSGETAAHRLRAMWVLHSIGAVDEAWLLEQSHDENEHVRVWSIKLLTDAGAVSDAALDRFVRLAKSESSGLVQLHLASVLRLLPLAKRWELARALAAKDTFAKDPVLPLMIWFGINPAVAADRTAAIDFISNCKIPKLRTFIARRLVESGE